MQLKLIAFVCNYLWPRPTWRNNRTILSFNWGRYRIIQRSNSGRCFQSRFFSQLDNTKPVLYNCAKKLLLKKLSPVLLLLHSPLLSNCNFKRKLLGNILHFIINHSVVKFLRIMLLYCTHNKPNH